MAGMIEIPFMGEMPKKVIPTGDTAKTNLYEGVVKALKAVPVHFSSPINIEGINATDLFTLNTLLGGAIEKQTTAVLNEIRGVWDPNGVWAEWDFRRFPESFPDVRLVNSNGDVALGVELKGWFILTKEKVPTYRFKVTHDACAPWDLLAVYPWSLNNVLSGSPVLHAPYVEQAQYAAAMRTYYWQHRDGGKSKVVFRPDVVKPYEGNRDAISDKPDEDGGGNFGRLSRVKGLTDEWVDESLRTKLAGIEARFWIDFLKLFKEEDDANKIEQGIDRISKKTAMKRDPRSEEILYHLEALLRAAK